jgi:exodeoxyribonuclease I
MFRMKETLYWYDLETFGRNPSWDKVAQFAGVRTDGDFNIIGDPLVIYCKITPDYLPDPTACFITGITPQLTLEKGLNEYDFIRAIDREFSVPGTCVAGFNSINFDDEFIRNLYYRNFKDPYIREWSKGNSRWDIINLLRGARDFRPEGIKWPTDEEGRSIFKLEELTKANGISHLNAHDALSDVEATIEMAKMVYKANPKFFSYFFSLRKREGVMKYIDLINKTPFYHTSPMYRTQKGSTTLLMPLGIDPSNKNALICYDLRFDPSDLLNLDGQQIKERVFTSIENLLPGERRVDLRVIHLNKCPMIAPLGTLSPKQSLNLGIDTDLCLDNHKKIIGVTNISQKVVEVFSHDAVSSTMDPDFQIYTGGFFKDEDKSKFALIHNSRKEDLLGLLNNFEDNRIPQMLWRFVCRNYPETLDSTELVKWKNFCGSRTINPPVKDGFDFNKIISKLNSTLDSRETNGKTKEIAMELLEYTKVLRNKILS